MTHIVGVVDHGQRQCHALGRRLGRVLDERHCAGGLVKQRVAGKQRRGVAIRSHAEQHKVNGGYLAVVAWSWTHDEHGMPH